MCRFARFLLVLPILFGIASLEGAEIGILKLDFDLVDEPGGRDPWYQIAVTLDVERGDRSEGANPRFASDVEVRFAVATSVERRGGRRLDYYSVSAEYPALEVGRHVVRFYLAPGVVKRDRIRGEPYAFIAEVSDKEGTVVSFVSESVRDDARLAAFQSRLEDADPAVLMLQEETPFAWTSPRESPVARRR